MTKKIFRSILTVSLAALLACLVIVMGVMYEYFSSIQKNRLVTELDLAVTGVETAGESYLAAIKSNDYRITWIDASGTVLFDSRADAAQMENHSGREEFKQALESGTGQTERYSATLTEKTLYYAKKLTDGTVLRISVQSATVISLVLGMLQPILVVFVIVLVLAGILASRMAKHIVKPLNELDLEHPLECNAYDELSPLLRRINQLYGQINAQLRELRRKNAEFAQITGSMSEGLVLLDEKGDVVNINNAAKALFGTDDSCIGGSFTVVERNVDVQAAAMQAAQNGHGATRLARNGREYQVEISRIEADGGAGGEVLLAFDVTDKVFAERNRREFTANVSHELKTPLQAIMGSAELIENGLVKPEDYPRFVGHIRTEAARLVALIEDIIRLSQLDESSALPFEEVDLYELCQEAIREITPAAEKKDVTIALSGQKTMVCGVKKLLAEVIFNLCDNAVKYNVQGGSVNVSVSCVAGGAQLRVADTGIGIPAEHQSRVFERFYRVDKSHSKQSGGTGLGLSIVKHAIECHGGTVEIESAEGKGSTFTVTLPERKE